MAQACQGVGCGGGLNPAPRPALPPRQLASSLDRRRWRCRGWGRGGGGEPQVAQGVPPPPPPPPPNAAAPAPLAAVPCSWLSALVLLGATVTTLGAGFLAFVLYLRPVLVAAERAAAAAERAAAEMEVAAIEMEKTAKMMQEDMPLTFQDMQRTSKEFEILGKQLNYLAGVVVKPVKEPVQWVGRAAETTSSTVGQVGSTVQSVTTTSIRRVVDDIKSLTNVLTPTINQVRDRLGLELGRAGAAAGKRLEPGAPDLIALAPGANGGPPLSRSAAAMTVQAEAAAREVAVGRRQADAQAWIAAWRSRTRGNRKAAASSPPPPAQREGEEVADSRRLEQMAQLLSDGMLEAQHEAATVAVFAALERAQRAAEEAASASGALEAAIKQAEDKGALPSMDEDDYE